MCLFKCFYLELQFFFKIYLLNFFCKDILNYYQKNKFYKNFT